MSQYQVALILLSLLGALCVATLAAAWLARMGYPIPENEHRVGHIDGLRGYLALCTLGHHFIIWLQVTQFGGTWSPPAINVFNQLGAGSVALFFMITGTLFYPKILKGIRPKEWRSMFIGRIFRIMPLLIFSVTVVFIVIALRTGRAPVLKDAQALMMWLSTWSEPPLLGYEESGRVNAHVLWSLWYEWVFYFLLFPLCAVGADLCRKLKIPTIFIPLTILFVCILASFLPHQLRLFFLVPLFAVGMLAHEIKSRPELVALLSTAPARWLAVLALVFAAIVFPSPYYGAVPFFGFFFVSVVVGNSLWGMLNTRAALVLGECSFGVYLLHGIFLDIYFVDVRAWLGDVDFLAIALIFPVIALLVVSFCSVSYLLIEKPGIRLGKELSRRLVFPAKKIVRPDFV